MSLPTWAFTLAADKILTAGLSDVLTGQITSSGRRMLVTLSAQITNTGASEKTAVFRLLGIGQDAEDHGVFAPLVAVGGIIHGTVTWLADIPTTSGALAFTLRASGPTGLLTLRGGQTHLIFEPLD